MSRKSIVVLLLIVGLWLSGCQKITPNPGTKTEPTGTEPVPVPEQATETLEPTSTQAEPTATRTRPVPSRTANLDETATQAAAATQVAAATQAPGATRPVVLTELFAGFPEEYQKIEVPKTLKDMLKAGRASIVPLPQERDKTTDQEKIARAVVEDGLLNPFDLDRLASFQDQSSFVAVPARNIPETPDFRTQGLAVGLVYDQDAFYGRTRQAVYEVVFFDDRAEVRDQNSGRLVKSFASGKEYFWTKSESGDEVLTFFIKNGCWLCWNAGGRTGCLICFGGE